jgi:cytochrome c biogenesis protein CcmG/thiol:disulfide interchange protein DsbE
VSSTYTRRMRLTVLSLIVAMTAASCGGADIDISQIPPVPATSIDEVRLLLDSSTEPVVLNVWASWCVPCRSEAPLLEKAATATPDVRFVGLNVRDDQDGARQFIAEFFLDAEIEHLFDSGGDIPIELGGSRAVPLTFFYSSGGELVTLHTGVIDERTLALQLDEILSR